MAISLLQNNNAGGSGGSLTSPANAKCLVLAVGSDALTTPTWNAVNLTTVITNTNCGIYYLLNPAIGTYTLVAAGNTNGCYAAFWLSGTHMGNPQRGTAEASGSDGWGDSGFNMTCSDAKKGDFIALAGWNYYAEGPPTWSGTGVTEDEDYTNASGHGSSVGHLTAAADNPVVTWSHEGNKEDEYSRTCWAAFRQGGGGGIMWWS